MSEPRPQPPEEHGLPRGLVRTALLVSFYAGPIGVFVLSMTLALETLVRRFCESCAVATGIDPPITVTDPLEAIFVSIVSAPISGLFSTLIGFLPTLVLGCAIFIACDAMPWLMLRRWWCAIGAVAGTVLGEVAFRAWGPLERTSDIAQACWIGALTGAICAAIAHHSMARAGAFVRTGWDPCDRP